MMLLLMLIFCRCFCCCFVVVVVVGVIVSAIFFLVVLSLRFDDYLLCAFSPKRYALRCMIALMIVCNHVNAFGLWRVSRLSG